MNFIGAGWGVAFMDVCLYNTRAIGEWSVGLAKLWSQRMKTYLTPISLLGHLFSPYQLLLGKDEFCWWKITDWDFWTCSKFSIGENILQITDRQLVYNRLWPIDYLSTTDINDRQPVYNQYLRRAADKQSIN
jgi:hypothetical protein